MELDIKQYCSSCGRDNSKVACIHNAKYTFYDQLFILLVITIIPTLAFGIYYNIYLDYSIINYFEVGSIVTSLILLVLLAAYYWFDKLYIVIFFGCHQNINRSISIFKQPFILCARCTGIMIGIFLSYFLSLGAFNYWILLLFGIPMIIDGIVQKKTIYISNNLKRFITGLLFGPTVVLLFGYFHFLISRFMVNLAINILT